MAFIEKQIERIFRRNYDLTKRLRLGKLVKGLTGQPPLVIYQMGKVGSTSVHESLKAEDLPFDIFHVHVLTHEWIKKINDQFRRASKIHGRAQVRQHVLESEYLRSLLDRRDPEMEWRIISIVRDPVARNVSTFFQGLSTYFPELSQQQDAARLSPEQRLPELLPAFLDNFEGHETPLSWFQTHLEPAFGIDIYQEQFPKKTGYQIVSSGNKTVLLLRLEDLETTAEDAFEQFLGLNNFRITKHNISERKAYAETYRIFKERLVLPTQYLDRLYGSAYAHHFYTDQQLDTFRRQWARK